MKIGTKILLVVLPLLVAPILIGGVSSSLSARNAVTSIAQESLQFKAEELYRYANSQWRVLVENNLTEKQEYVSITKDSVSSYAEGLIRSSTELLGAVKEDGTLEFSTLPVNLSSAEQRVLVSLFSPDDQGWTQLEIGGTRRVGQLVWFEPFQWMFLVTEEEQTFYSVVEDIYRRTGIILLSTLVIAIILVFVFTRTLLKPLNSMNAVISDIISSGDLSRRVPLLYRDEIGDLGHRFNIMTEELEKAYGQIKRYAYQAVIARKQERKIRNIFQKYVPIDVIDQVFSKPESLLKGDNRQLAVLFSDIRGFTTIAEALPPEEIVESLNNYFSRMVDIIMSRSGIVDKYIGDAIMAFFGAPVRHDDDPEASVLAGLDMLDALQIFNRSQIEHDAPQFQIGIGINFGTVTIGNIGSEKKMDYTVIGDMVNLASRLEGLTKVYHQPLLISGSIAKTIYKKIPCRLIDKVRVKGKQVETAIYAPKRILSDEEKKGWNHYHEGLKFYYKRDFTGAAKKFLASRTYLDDDIVVKMFLDRCRIYIKEAPPDDWDGVVTISEK